MRRGYEALGIATDKLQGNSPTNPPAAEHPQAQPPQNKEELRLLYVRFIVLERIKALTEELEILKHAQERVKQTISWMAAMEAMKE